MQPTGLTLPDDLGVLGDIMALGSRVDWLHGTDARSGRTGLDVCYQALPGGRFGVLCRAMLREGIAIETGVEIDSLETGAAAKLVDDKARSIGSFDLMIDASDLRSRLRRHADVPVERELLAYREF